MIRLVAIFLAIICGVVIGWSLFSANETREAPVKSEGRVRVGLSGGHETNPVDKGRPVILIAAALGVEPEVFREAFSGVRPAPGGTHPDRERVRKNKEVLMKALGPYGITNDRLDTVSNYYRYNPGRGEMWPTDEATAYAIVEGGMITGFEVTDGGSGYSSPPKVTVPGFEGIFVEAQLAFGKDFETNGSISSIVLKSQTH
ncbi:MAG: hypothetical protein KC964_15880 [Candidatus Omnitrophica bacterium]|nr:hypothetical protein [Candidatus Omnitrophota bacterium]